MAAPTYKFLRDWIFHNLGDLKEIVTSPEVAAEIAEVSREVSRELKLDDMLATDTITFSSTDGYATLPTDCAICKKIGILNTSTNELKWYPLIGYSETGLRKYYDDKNLYYLYMAGRNVYPSWDFSDDFDATIYYTPVENDDFMVLDTTEIGADTGHLPISMLKIIRFGVLWGLYLVHGQTELHAYKARQFKQEYYERIDREKINSKKNFERYEHSEIRNY